MQAIYQLARLSGFGRNQKAMRRSDRRNLSQKLCHSSFHTTRRLRSRRDLVLAYTVAASLPINPRMKSIFRSAPFSARTPKSTLSGLTVRRGVASRVWPVAETPMKRDTRHARVLHLREVWTHCRLHSGALSLPRSRGGLM